MAKTLTVLVFIFSFAGLAAQNQTLKDSTKIETLEEVVVTGQHNPQSVGKSVFEVKVISRKDIERQAGNNLADVLNNTLNLNVTPNTSTGKSGVSLFGLDSQYMKVLIDNIPLINEEGMGNNTDLTLINLDDVERIEIVEGAMGVQYGANAVSGIINVITKKSSRSDWEINTYLQEESINTEYEWFNKGRHIQSIKLGHNLNDRIYANATYSRNDFGGYWGDKLGEKYDRNDGLRGHEWLPKLQQNAKMLLSYTEGDFSIFYRFDYLNETIENYNKQILINENPATGTTRPTAQDAIFNNNRFYHHLNATGPILKKMNYNISLSYQEQTKDIERYTYIIREDRKEIEEKGEYQNRSAFFSRGTFSNIINSKSVSLQAGYELTNERGSGSAIAIVLTPGEEGVSQKLNNYDFFASSEFSLFQSLSLRPGARVSFSNLFETQLIGSLSAKQALGNGWELRAILGSANRTPSYDELYTYFVDVNHNVQGNPELLPEKGVSAFLHLKKSSSLNKGKVRLKNKLSFNYLNLVDRIELIEVNTNPLEYQFSNIDRYKTIGAFTENQIFVGNITAQLGLSFQGISKIFEERDSNDDYLFNFQLNANLGYTLPKWNTTLSAYYKYIGKQPLFYQTSNAEGEAIFEKRATEAYSWMDATINQPLFKNTFNVTLGVRNLFDLTSANTVAIDGGAHSSASNLVQLGYGRSYFLQLAYNLNF